MHTIVSASLRLATALLVLTSSCAPDPTATGEWHLSCDGLEAWYQEGFVGSYTHVPTFCNNGAVIQECPCLYHYERLTITIGEDVHIEVTP